MQRRQQQRQRGTRQLAERTRQRQREIIRNRIIAVAVLVVVVVVVVSLVGNAIKGGQPSQEENVATSAPTQNGGTDQAAQTPATNGQPSTGDQAPATGTTPDPSTPVIGVEDPWVPSGRFTTGDAELDTMLKEYCDANSSPDKTAEENAYSVYLAISWSDDVERHEGEQYENQHPQGPDWDTLYSKQFLWANGGNCYEFSAITGFALQYFGYADAHGEPCQILLESGGYGPHGLVLVTNKDGTSCVCDNAMGSNGWMLPATKYTFYVDDIGQGEPTPNTSIGVV